MAVVGAGVAGAVAALSLVRRGARVALLDASSPASGATGRSGGFIVPAFSAVSPDALLREKGEAAERLIRFVAGSADVVFSLVREHRLDCDAAQNGWFHPAKTAKALDRLEKNAALWLAAGGRGTMHDARETSRLTGTRGYLGCWEARSGGTLHPVRFVNGLIGRARETGLRLITDTPVTAMSRNGGAWRLETPRGTLTADTVLVCTNARSPLLAPGLHRSVVALQVCQLATRPIPERERAALLRQGQSLTDTQTNLFSYRFDRDWRLISGAIPVLPFSDGRRLAARIARRLQRELSLPSLPEPEFVWSGHASVTSDFLPHVYELDTGVYAVTACNGRGLALSTALAAKIAEALVTRSFEGLPVSLQKTPAATRGRSLKTFAGRLYPLYGFVRDKLDAWN